MFSSLAHNSCILPVALFLSSTGQVFEVASLAEMILILKHLKDLKSQVNDLTWLPKVSRQFLRTRDFEYDLHVHKMILLVKQMKATLLRIRSLYDRESELPINEDITGDACGICLEEFPQRCTGRVCGHAFCRECILEYSKQKDSDALPCPFRRFEIERTDSTEPEHKRMDAAANKASEKISSVISSASERCAKASSWVDEVQKLTLEFVNAMTDTDTEASDDLLRRLQAFIESPEEPFMELFSDCGMLRQLVSHKQRRIRQHALKRRVFCWK